MLMLVFRYGTIKSIECVRYNTPDQAHALNSENKQDSATTDTSIIINDVVEKEDQVTYAKVAALKPAVNNNTIELMDMETMNPWETFQSHKGSRIVT